jgi:hypothetical protein
VEVADLVLPSGQVVACDPTNFQWENDTVPFCRTAPPGKYPVTLCLASNGNQVAPDRGTVACAMVRFATGTPTAWEMAVRPGQDASTLPAGRFFGYGVDAGMGCFVDLRSIQALSIAERQDVASHRVTGEMYEGGKYRCAATLVLDENTGGNLVVFSSGDGDGAYASYWGLGAHGEPCCLVTDFGILVEYLQGQSTFRLKEWIGKPIAHPDLNRIGLTVRPLRLGKAGDHRLRLQLKGGSCKAVIVNGDKEYSSDRLPYTVRGRIGTYDFCFDEPLGPDARITLEYGLGAQALQRLPT